MSSPIGTDPAKLHPDFKINWETLATEGHVNVSDITLPLKARIKDKLDGDVKLTTWTSSIDFFAGGGMRIDVDHPELTMAKAVSLGKRTSIRVGKFGADKLAYQGLGRQPHAVRPRTQRVGPHRLGQDQRHVKADTGSITVDKLHNASLSFDDLFTPNSARARREHPLVCVRSRGRLRRRGAS